MSLLDHSKHSKAHRLRIRANGAAAGLGYRGGAMKTSASLDVFGTAVGDGYFWLFFFEKRLGLHQAMACARQFTVSWQDRWDGCGLA